MTVETCWGTDDVVQPRRERLQALVDALPEGELANVEQLLESFATADPSLRAALLAPVDDEPLSDAEITSIERSKRAIARGEYVADDIGDRPDVYRA
jgi:hypothetical protein